MKVILIDNYDSFTYNLVQYIEEIEGIELTVMKNDAIDQESLNTADKLIISPGPGLPEVNGQIIGLIRAESGRRPILGVCLGLQAIYEAFGGSLKNLDRVYHGVSTQVHILDRSDRLFTDIPDPFTAGRYHSWVCDPESIPADLIITAVDDDDEIMACKHRHHPTYGVQFHPESFLTPKGKLLIRNFVNL